MLAHQNHLHAPGARVRILGFAVGARGVSYRRALMSHHQGPMVSLYQCHGLPISFIARFVLIRSLYPGIGAYITILCSKSHSLVKNQPHRRR